MALALVLFDKVSRAWRVVDRSRRRAGAGGGSRRSRSRLAERSSLKPYPIEISDGRALVDALARSGER